MQQTCFFQDPWVIKTTSLLFKKKHKTIITEKTMAMGISQLECNISKMNEFPSR